MLLQSSLYIGAAMYQSSLGSSSYVSTSLFQHDGASSLALYLHAIVASRSQSSLVYILHKAPSPPLGPPFSSKGGGSRRMGAEPHQGASSVSRAPCLDERGLPMFIRGPGLQSSYKVPSLILELAKRIGADISYSSSQVMGSRTISQCRPHPIRSLRLGGRGPH